jgi:hypothetical protein
MSIVLKTRETRRWNDYEGILRAEFNGQPLKKDFKAVKTFFIDFGARGSLFPFQHLGLYSVRNQARKFVRSPARIFAAS